MSLRTPPIAALLLLAVLTACSGGAGESHLPAVTPSSTQASRHPQDTLGGVGGLLSILLCDAPPNIGNLTPSAINLAVDSVAVVSNGQVVTIAQYQTPYIVNVLQQQNGNAASIGIGQYFSGAYQAVQFTFDASQSAVVANGTNYPINFVQHNNARSTAGAGGSTAITIDSGKVTVTVPGNFLIGGNPAASIQADFNALESLAQNNSGQIVSRPTLFAVPGSQAGAINGTVTNRSGAAVSGATVVAIDANGSVANTTSTDATGAYNLHTLAAGTYTLVIYNSYTTVVGQTVTASGNSNAAQSVTGPSVTVTGQTTTQAPALQD